VAKIPPRHQVTGDQRTKVQRELVAKYRKGASIRGLAAEYGRSYGFMHRILTEAGIALRGRGGAVRKVQSREVVR
jgi:hypothetical protein